MTSLEHAIKIETELRATLDSSRAALASLDNERKALAYGAHTGNAKAKSELDALNKRRAAHALDLEGLEVAHAHAGARVDEARREAARAVELDRARKVRSITDAAAGRGMRIAEAVRTLRDEILRMTADLDEARRLGAPIANGRLVSLAMTRSILPMLREAGLEIDVIAPGMRHDVQKLIDDYLQHARTWADKQLNDASSEHSVAAA